jgi:hypothetical protein
MIVDETKTLYTMPSDQQIRFQRGTRFEYGVNGVVEADLVEVLQDRVKPNSKAAKLLKELAGLLPGRE